MNRRHLIQLSLMAALASVQCRQAIDEAEEVEKPGPPRKKGLGIVFRDDEWARKISELRCKWHYAWNPNVPEEMPEGIEFIPMIFRSNGDREMIIDAGKAARAAGIGELLGFNEPDKKNQGNMTVEEALAVWPYLEDTGLRLGSPGCVQPDKEWMLEFMKEVEKREMRVDFVCVHNYGGPSAEALVKRLESVHKMYGKPIWITEFAVGDWEAKTVAQNRHKPERVLRFMEEVLPRLESLDFVERYAWFPAKPDNRALGTSALFDEDGQLTRLGECYRDA